MSNGQSPGLEAFEPAASTAGAEAAGLRFLGTGIGSGNLYAVLCHRSGTNYTDTGYYTEIGLRGLLRVVATGRLLDYSDDDLAQIETALAALTSRAARGGSYRAPKGLSDT